MIRNYFITALRNLRRSKAFSAINIIGLSLGLACCMLIFLYVMDEVSYDRFHVNAVNIYQLVVDSKSPDGQVHKFSGTGNMPGPAFKAQLPEITGYVRLYGTDYTVKRGNEVFDQPALFVDSNFFSVFTFPLLYGNPKTALNDPSSIVLSEDVAQKYFGNVNPVGQTLELKVHKQFQSFTVTAVTKKSAANSSIKITMLVPQKLRVMDEQWLSYFQNTFLVVRPGTDIKQLTAKINKVYLSDAASQIQASAAKDQITYVLQPLSAVHTSTDYPANNGLSDASNPMYSYVLSGIGLFILAIACINFVNLTVARSLKRAKEIGIRKVMGGLRRQLIMQFLGESFTLSLIAFLLAIILMLCLLPLFNTLTGKQLSFSYLVTFKLIAGYIGIFLFTSLLAGFYPALVLSAFNPVQTLYNRTQYAGKNYLSKALVVLQFTLATFLITATIAIYSQFNYLMNFNLGYNDKNVVTVTGFALDEAKLATFKTELSRDPNILSVSADQGGGAWATSAVINGFRDFKFNLQHVDEDYLNLFQVPVIKGRGFLKAMAADSAGAVLVSEEFVKQAGWENPIGETVSFPADKRGYQVVGVVKDYHFQSLTEKMSPVLYSMKPDFPWGNIYIRIGGKNKPDVIERIQKEFKADFPLLPFQYKFKEDEVAAQYAQEARWKQIVSFAALLTIFISCIGLFGLATLSAERRKKEIGIRKVLGASVRGITALLSLDFVKLVVISIGIASPFTWWAISQWLQKFAYKITISWWIFAAAGTGAILISLLTVSFQSAKAAIANPVKSLRSE
jgi:putative ABC transport system permease protein